MPKPTLLPCPFCGSDNVDTEVVSPHTHKVATFMPDYKGGAMATCYACCAAHWRDGPNAEQEVIEAWNRRASPAGAQGAVAYRWWNGNGWSYGERPLPGAKYYDLFTHPPAASEDAADAARYRWLRRTGVSIDPSKPWLYREDADAAIDAARDEEKG